MTCICQNCNKEFKVDVIIDDNLWKKIKPKNSNELDGLLCGQCIMGKIESVTGYAAFTLSRHIS